MAGLLLAVGISACRDSVEPPEPLPSGTVTFAYDGTIAGAFSAVGPCLRTPGAPPVGETCAYGLLVGDTIRVSAIWEPWTVRWRQFDLLIPVDGTCDAPDACPFAYSYLDRVGGVERELWSIDARASVTSYENGRLTGTFSGSARSDNALAPDSIGVVDGVFDVPVVTPAELW